MSENKIIVYAPNGTAERHTRANARDLVNGAGYSWHPTIKTPPTSYAPFAGQKAPDGPPPSQRVLDSVGGSNAVNNAAKAGAAQAQEEEMRRIQESQAAMMAPAAAPAEPVEVVDYSDAPAVDSSDLDDDDAAGDAEADASAEEAPKPRRGRPRKS